MGALDEMGIPFQGGRSPTPRISSPLEQFVTARGLLEGTNQFQGVNLDEIPKEFLNPAERKRLKETAGIDFDAGPVSLETLLAAGVSKGEFREEFANQLSVAGLIRPFWETPDSPFIEANVPLLEEMRRGVAPEVKQMRETLNERALGMLESSASRESLLQDPFIQAALSTQKEGLRSAYASRGMNQSGMAALTESAMGLQTLEGLRQSRQAEGLGLMDAANQANFGQLALPLDLANLNWQQQLAQGTMLMQLRAISRAERVMEESLQLGTIFGRNFAASQGQSLGSFTAGGPFSGGGGGGGIMGGGQQQPTVGLGSAGSGATVGGTSQAAQTSALGGLWGG